MTFRKMFCFRSNDYYAENHGLKWTENLRSVQFKFTKNLNFSSVQVLFWKSELNSVQSSPKNELLNWTELFSSVRAIHCYLQFKYICFWNYMAKNTLAAFVVGVVLHPLNVNELNTRMKLFFKVNSSYSGSFSPKLW